MSDENPAAESMLRQRQIIIERQRDTIERLEAELADVTQRYRDADRRWDEQYAVISAELADTEAELAEVRQSYRASLAIIAHLRAELADLRASSVVVRERCETCDGRALQPCPNEHLRCPDCVDGWRLAEGVVKLATGHYWLPARLIEGRHR